MPVVVDRELVTTMAELSVGYVLLTVRTPA
jgi:hypothetical protein